MRISKPLALALLVLVAPLALAATRFTGSEVEVTNLYSVYAPSHLVVGGTERMWSGGWLTQADVGPDKIYLSERTSGAWSHPTLCFAKPGYHVNDPSVIRHPSQPSWLFMYYTALANKHATAAAMTRHNWVGFASSVDGGKTWTDHGIVIGQNNGLDNRGAWAPSAVVVGNEIWVYYHTNSPGIRILRTRFELNGWQRRGTDLVIGGTTTIEGQQVYLSNVDVQKVSGGYVMVANTTELQRIVRLVSSDGLNWHEPSKGRSLLVQASGNHKVLTPHWTKSGNGFVIRFGWDTGKGSNSIHAWSFVD